ncbi:hypothetical protein GCM10012275_32320 [Longimycelium tulufanense]|uniref:Uncharacterized protein n=1 Tax=Longimycelium tulufanense TaxID=907463 RepID=A0A8J3CEZ3_9PSEU|nr:hypothetical protein GCM10012275_32320 [Longimycelium tulufanense]
MYVSSTKQWRLSVRSWPGRAVREPYGLEANPPRGRAMPLRSVAEVGATGVTAKGLLRVTGSSGTRQFCLTSRYGATHK